MAVGAARRALQKPAPKSRIVVPDDRPNTGAGKILISGRHELAGVMLDSLSTHQVARMLDITPPSVVRRIRARSLYAIPLGRGWLIPKFQFRDGVFLRGMSKVSPRLDPLGVINWFSIPNPDLVMSGEAVSPGTWLEGGGDIGSVVALAVEAGGGL